MILMMNILIYMQCDWLSDLAYFKVHTQLIFSNLESDEAERLLTFDEVKSVEKVKDGGRFICYIDLQDEYANDYDKCISTAFRFIDNMQLSSREPYAEACRKYEKYGILSSDVFNTRYMYEVKDSPASRPEMMLFIIMAGLMNLAAVSLVFGMKIKRSSSEYAAMRSMGASFHAIRMINYIEAMLITLVSFPLSFGISTLTLYILSRASASLYPEYKMNSLLGFGIPWGLIAALFVVYLITTIIGVHIAVRSISQRTISELAKGVSGKLPYVEKSSTKLLESADFSYYGKLETKRNIRNLIPTQVLFAFLVLLPAYIAIAVLTSYSNGTFNSIYTFESNRSDDTSYITESLVELVASVDGCKVKPSYMVFYDDYNNIFTNEVDLYDELKVHTALEEVNKWADENVPDLYCVTAPEEIYSVGDVLHCSYNGKKFDITVTNTKSGLFRKSKFIDTEYYNAYLEISSDTLADMNGWDEARYTTLTVYGEEGREEEQIKAIEKCALMSGNYVNDHDRQLHQTNEYGFTGKADFIERKIWQVYDTFIEMFLMAEMIYLFVCAGMVIYSISEYEVSGRRREFSTLRALGISENEVSHMSERKQSFGIVIMSVVALIMMFAFCLIMDENIIKEQNFKMMPNWPLIGKYAVADVIVVFMLLIGYGVSAVVASRKTVRKMFEKTIASEIKGDE